VLQQGQHGAAQQVHGALVTGDDQHHGRAHEFLLGQPAVLLVAYGDQGGQQVVLGAAAFVRDKISQQPVQTGQCRAVLGRGHPERMGRPAAEVQVVLLGDAEEFGDDRGGQWGVEHLDDVGLARRRQRVDQVVGDLLDARRQFGRTAAG